MSDPVLRAEGLTLEYRIGDTWYTAVRDVSLAVEPGQIHGLVGESGSGKSTVALALMGSLAPNARIAGGRVWLDGESLLDLSPADLRQRWGRVISLVPQDALAALNPSFTVGEQIAEVARLHLGLGRGEAWLRAVDMLNQVRIEKPATVAKKYPHQLSGGMQQRVMIAMALVARPRALILDEPTTALDVTTQAAILDLVRDLVAIDGAAAVYVSHDLELVRRLCDPITVLYGGEVMESGASDRVTEASWHPYTISLMASLPRITRNPTTRLPSIPGSAPSLTARPPACVFSDRCPVALDQCVAEKPPIETTPDGRLIRCWRWREIAGGTLGIVSPDTTAHTEHRVDDTVLLRAASLEKTYAGGARALDSVTVRLRRGETLGVVGESGSGKTTLARVIVGLEAPDSGEIELLELRLAPVVEGRKQSVKRQLQMIFQNPADALNPYQTVGGALGRTVERLTGETNPGRIRERVQALLEQVRLSPDYAQRLPSELSGGERQRVGIARAFAAEPALILADEPTSALDVSVQAAILNLLKDLRAERQTAYLFISHDLRAVSYLADRILVMVRGQIVEEATPEQFAAAPFHPYSEVLLASQNGLSADTRESETGSPVTRACPFADRCPRKVGPICDTTDPPWQATAEGHHIRCHIPLADLTALQSPEDGP